MPATTFDSSRRKTRQGGGAGRIVCLAGVALLGLAIRGATGRADEPVVNRPDVLDEGRFLMRLHDYGMVELVQAYVKDNPAAGGTADTLAQELEARKAVASDPKLADKDREAAWNALTGVLTELTTKHAGDPRINQWRAEKAGVLLDIRVEPRSKRMLYEIASAQDRDEVQVVLADVEKLISAALPEIENQLKQIEDAPHFNVEEYDKLDTLRQRLTYQNAMTSFYRAELAWVRGVRLSAGGEQAQLLVKASAVVGPFFMRFAKDEDATRRVRALLLLGWSYLFNDRYDLAANQADAVINDPQAPAMAKMEAYALKARAFRSAGRFGETAPLAVEDIRNWVTFCVELSKQQARTAASPLKRIWELLPADVRKDVQSGAMKDLPEASKTRVIAVLNDILNRSDFYRAEDFKGAALPTEALKLLERGVDKLSGPALRRFNRLAMETALGRTVAESQLGALAVLDEQAALIASEPALKDSMWQVLNMLARANTIIQQAINSAQVKLRDARDLERRNELTKAEEIRNQAQAEYDKARNTAIELLQEFARTNDQASALAAAVMDIMVTDPELEKQSLATTQPGGVPTAEELARTPDFQLKRMASKARQGQQYELAIACYRELLRRAEALPDRALSRSQQAEALDNLGQTCYFWGRKQEEAKAEDFPAHYARAAEYFARELPLAGPGEKKDILVFIRSSLLKQPDVYAVPAKRDRLVEVLQELKNLSEGDELDANRLYLGQALAKSGKHRAAATEYGQVSAANPYHDVARELQVQAILDLYSVTRPQGIEADQAIRDLTTLEQFGGFSVKKAAEMEANADKLEKDLASSPTSQPEVAEKIARLRKRAAHLRDVGPDYKLEAGRIFFDVLADEPRSVRILDAVAEEFPHRPDIRSRARSYKIRIFLIRRQYDRAIDDLLKLIEEDQPDAEPLLDNVLGALESDYNRLRAEQKREEARQKALQAEQFARTLVEQAKTKTALPKEVQDDCVIRWARTLNWLERHEDAARLLQPLYVAPRDTDGDGKITDKDNYTKDPDLIIERADALFALGQYREAVDMYNVITRTETMTFGEIWWRALLGQCESNLLLNEAVRDSHKALMMYRAQAEQKEAAKLVEDKNKYALRDWLVPRYSDVLARLEQKPEVQATLTGTTAPDREQAPPAEEGISQGVVMMLVVAGGAVGMVAITVVYFSRLRRLARASGGRGRQ